nr:MAG TPA: hypothetical protein [Caudoviricetes sp.]
MRLSVPSCWRYKKDKKSDFVVFFDTLYIVPLFTS